MKSWIGIIVTFIFFVFVIQNMDLRIIGSLDPNLYWLNVPLFGSFLFFHSFFAGMLRRDWYMFVLGIQLILVMVLWEPNDTVIWDFGISNWYPGLFFVALLIWITRDHGSFAFVGLRPFEKKYIPYKFIKHPMHLCQLGLFWCAPLMDVDRLLAAGMVSLYLFFAIPIEEKRIANLH